MVCEGQPIEREHRFIAEGYETRRPLYPRIEGRVRLAGPDRLIRCGNWHARGEVFAALYRNRLARPRRLAGDGMQFSARRSRSVDRVHAAAARGGRQPGSAADREMDIEISRWGELTGKNSQYVIQPSYIAANVVRFLSPPGRLTYSFDLGAGPHRLSNRPRRGRAGRCGPGGWARFHLGCSFPRQ